MDKLKVETKRMLLQPMSDSEIEEMMAEMHFDDLRAAYGEMLAERCLRAAAASLKTGSGMHRGK